MFLDSAMAHAACASGAAPRRNAVPARERYRPVLARLETLGRDGGWRRKKTPQQGAATLVFAAASPLLAGIGGVYLKDNDISPLDDAADPTAQGADLIRSQNVVPHSIDPHSARRLGEMTEQLIEA